MYLCSMLTHFIASNVDCKLSVSHLQRDLGLWVEAEQLLSDVCSYYSEDQWSHLFVKAYSLLAECQNKLQMEDKYPLDVIIACKHCQHWVR